VLTGAGIATVLFLRYFVDMIYTGGVGLEALLGGSIQYLGAAMACIVVGAALWKEWQIPVAEFWVIAGAFCLGVAFRSNGFEAEVHGAFGLSAFVIGYLILTYNADRRKTKGPDPKIREETMRRIMNSELPSDAATLTDTEESDPSDSNGATSSLASMIHNLGAGVKPITEKVEGVHELLQQR
jgi:glucose dehydrogenase